jgi:hypothetical protein
VTLDSRREIVDVARELDVWGSKRNWSGTDPYDGLNAERLLTPLLRWRRGRQAITQLVKRSPINLRTLLGIDAAQSSAALAQIVSAYARNGFLPHEEADAKLGHSLAMLESLRCEGFEQPCWGYHFDVQTRVFFYPRGAPNTIATAFAGLALLDAFEATGEAHLLKLAEGSGEFFLEHVPETETECGAYFGYLVEDRTPIHNANMLVCALLARLGSLTGRDDMLAAAEAGVAYTVSRQRDDGSWPYGEEPHLAWVDSFHTGYVLECLLVCGHAGLNHGVQPAVEAGLDFYRRKFFLADGTPKYLANAVYPIDVQCAAQGIQTFAHAGERETALRVFEFARRKLRRRDGAFIFQQRRLWRNRTPHVRWSAAPMMLALTHLLERR